MLSTNFLWKLATILLAVGICFEDPYHNVYNSSVHNLQEALAFGYKTRGLLFDIPAPSYTSAQSLIENIYKEFEADAASLIPNCTDYRKFSLALKFPIEKMLEKLGVVYEQGRIDMEKLHKQRLKCLALFAQMKADASKTGTCARDLDNAAN